MKLLVQEALMSFDHFTVWDADGAEKYTGDRELFQLSRTVHLSDLQGRNLVTVSHIPFTVPSCWSVEIPTRTLSLQKHITLMKTRFTVEELGWEVERPALSFDYTVTDASGREVASIYKEWPALHDRYTLEIADPANELAVLGVVIAIDCQRERERN